MRCPSLSELPAPERERTGWPWTEETPGLPDMTPDGRPWPRISIVTPSYNQGQFLEETIRSVLLQGYPDLEYIIIDGGSTDETVNIIKKYEQWLAYSVSEKDRGQSHAINKGLERATGEFAAYQNSDDVYRPDAFRTVATCLKDGSADVLFATGDIIDEQSHRHPPVCPIPEPSIDRLIRFWWGPTNIMPSHGFFFRLQLVRTLGCFDEKLHYKMDMELMCRLLEVLPANRVRRTEKIVADYRIYQGAKTGLMSSESSAKEGLAISKRYWNRYSPTDQKQIAREARQGCAFMCMCRAQQEATAFRFRRAFGELLKAWVRTPSLAFSRWSLYIMAKSLTGPLRKRKFPA